MPEANDKIQLFKSLFRGREDVFAKRWDAKDKSGYAPAYDIDWTHYAIHKATGGSLKDYPHKSYSRLSDRTIEEHLAGKDVIGIYPLLENNTSWFAAVDFDENDWRNEIIKLYAQCCNFHLPAYLERSRSGNGGHLWIFFEQPYPAIKIRAIIKELLKFSSIDHKLSDSSSFDRIFPNQDFHSGKGFGNLIALPLQLKAIENGNSCFIDPTTLEPYSDQWNFLSSMQKVEVTTLETLYENFTEKVSNTRPRPSLADVADGSIQIILDDVITIGRSNLPSDAVLFLRDNLKVTNPNFFIRKATGQSTYEILSSETLLVEDTDRLHFPRGYIGTFLRYCKANNFKYNLNDLRQKLPEINFAPKGQLYDHQLPALAATEKKEMGVIIAPPGAGKTIIGLSIISKKKQPALIIVHRRQLFDQWIQRIQSFLGIPKYRIGRINGTHIDIGEQITVAMIQSIGNAEVIATVEKSFGLILIDECHHVASESYRNVLKRLHTYYLYGLTATPIRKNRDEKMIFAQIGDIIHELIIPKGNDNNSEVIINVRDTDFEVPFDAATDNFETLSNILIHDSTRNSLIADDIRNEINYGRTILVITERKAHVEILYQFLKQYCEVIAFSGDDTGNSKSTKIKQIEEGCFQVLVTTGQLMGEGIDIDILDCAFFVYPCSFHGKLIQYTGRVQRSNNQPTIYDYRDLKIPYLEKMFQNRNKHYNRLTKAGLIKVFEEYLLKFEEDRFYFGSQINAYPISILDLGIDVDCFHKNVIWKIKVLNYNETKNYIYVEILNYNIIDVEEWQQLSVPLFAIEQIRFRTIDTAGLLKSVVLKKTVVQPLSVPQNLSLTGNKNKNQPPLNPQAILPVLLPVTEQSWLFEKIIKVPFKKTEFGNGVVTIQIYLSAIGKDISIEIVNTDVRPEFEVIKEYFSKILKTKTITANLKIKHNRHEVLSYEVSSEEISAINADIIDSMRFEFVRRNFRKFHGIENKSLLSFDDLKQADRTVGVLLESETVLLDEVLKMESAKHYLHIKYLAPKHETSLLKLRFILQPFSFIFLLAGEKKYHLIWETLDSEEATYLWHIDKNKEALQAAIKEIETSLNEMKQTGRNSYIKKAPAYFSRIIHDYSDAKKGFIEWKGMLEERLA